jgi:hypothetical protein
MNIVLGRWTVEGATPTRAFRLSVEYHRRLPASDAPFALRRRALWGIWSARLAPSARSAFQAREVRDLGA